VTWDVTFPQARGRKLVTYAVVGVGVFLVDFLVFLSLIRVAGLSPLTANPISRSLGGLACFLGHRFITFNRRGGRTLPRHALRFLAVYLVALALSQVYLWLFHHICGIPAPVAKPMAEGLVFFGNFLLLGQWAFA
jgi:putative flippase GtrA